MQHYHLGHWIDFVHGFGSETARTAMEEHLAAGCPACRLAVSRLRVLAAIARHEAQYKVSPGALEFARSLGNRLARRPWLLSRRVARLVFDTMQAPLVAGVRGDPRASRHAWYQTGDYSVDVQMEPGGSLAAMTLIGQIVSVQNPPASLSNLAVAVASHRAVLAQTASNDLGEFQVELVPEPELKLYIQTNRESSLEVPLDNLRADFQNRGAGL